MHKPFPRILSREMGTHLFTVPLYFVGEEDQNIPFFAHTLFQAHGSQKQHLPSEDYSVSTSSSWVAFNGKNTMYMTNIHCCHPKYWQRAAAKIQSVSLLQEHEEELKYEYSSQIAYRKGMGKEKMRVREREGGL